MTALAKVHEENQKFSGDQIELIRRTICKGATDDELKLFLYDCQRRNIHPLDKLLHFTKRGGRYTPITSIDLLRSRAAETGELAGSDDAVFEQDPAKSFPTVARVTVYRLTQGERYPYVGTARWSEYCPESDAFMWKKMPHTMLAKCAEALALRKAFPAELSGLYTTDEMEQAISAPEPQPEPKVIPPKKLREPESGLYQPLQDQSEMPRKLTVPPLANNAGPDYRAFATELIGIMRSCPDNSTVFDWQHENQSIIDDMAKRVPKMRENLVKAIEEITSEAS